MIQKFLEYIMRGRKQAVWVAMLFVFVPFFEWVSNVILALVTLRISILEGFYILLWISLPKLVLLSLKDYSGHLMLYVMGINSLLTWILAGTLRTTVSWRTVLWVMTGVGLVSISLIYLLIPEVQTGLLLKLQELASLAQQAKVFTLAEPPTMAMLKLLVKNIIGMAIAGLLLSAISNVLIGRWCQAKLYNPGGFRRELRELKLDRAGSMVFIALLATVLTRQPLAIDSSTIICLPLVLIGISLAHSLLAEQKYADWALIVFYMLLFIFLPLMTKLLLVLALLDGLIDIRKKLKEVM